MVAVFLIPAYNPDIMMIDVIRKIYSEPNLKYDKKILIINDGSNKKSEKYFAQAICMGATVLRHECNRGKGRAIKTGLEYINKYFSDRMIYQNVNIVIVDADGQHQTNDIIKVLKCLDQNKDSLVLGSRKFNGKVPMRSKLGNKFTKGLFMMVTGKKIHDTQTGLRAFDLKNINFFIQVKGERYEYEINELLMACKCKLNIKEVEIETIYIDQNQSSHFRPVLDSCMILGEIIRFSSVSVVSFFIDYLLFIVLNLLSNNIVLSNIIARFMSASVNFTLNRRYVFKSKDKIKKELIRYCILAGFILTINTILMKIFAYYLGINRYLVKVVVEIFMFVINYLIQKIYIFGNRTIDVTEQNEVKRL